MKKVVQKMFINISELRKIQPTVMDAARNSKHLWITKGSTGCND